MTRRLGLAFLFSLLLTTTVNSDTPPIKFMGLTVIPGAGIKESTDYGLHDVIVRADDIYLSKPKQSLRTPDNLRGFPGGDKFTPPRDRVADKINESLEKEKGNSNVRPVLAIRNQKEIVSMAKSLGRPVIFWTFWPDTYDTTSEFFEELSEAQHVLMTNEDITKFQVGAGEYINYKNRDGSTRWLKASDIFGKDTAVKLRRVWDGETRPTPDSKFSAGDPDLLSRNEKRAILEEFVVMTYSDGRRERMTIRECVNRGGKITAEICEAKGWSADQGAFAMSLGPRTGGTMQAGGGVGSYSNTVASLNQPSPYQIKPQPFYNPAPAYQPPPVPQARPMPAPPIGRFSGPLRGG